MLRITLLLLVFCCSTQLSAQSGQICFIRSTGYVGSAVNFKVFIDDSLACKLKNKSYSLHTVSAGEHVVAAANTGLGNKKKSAPFTVNVQEGKITYVDVIWANKVSTEEVTENSGIQKIKPLVQNTKCSSEESDN